MEIFFDGMDKENSKTRRKGHIKKIEKKKKRRKEWRKEKEEILKDMEVPILMCFP